MTMTTLNFWDSAYPIASPPLADGMCFYVGGDTPHVWTVAEVASYRYRYRLPIWVRSDPLAVSADSDANSFLALLHGRFRMPGGTLVCLDSETSIDPAYVQRFVYLMNQGGHPVIDYGSRSFVFGNGNPDGYYFAADWTNQPHTVPGAQMVQFRSLAAYDLDTASSALPFWDLAPPPPPPPPQEDDVITGFVTSVPDNIPLPPGKFTKLAVFLDNLPGSSFPVTIRVAMRNPADGTFAVENIELTGHTPFVLPLSPAGTDAVSIVRVNGSNGTYPGYTIY